MARSSPSGFTRGYSPMPGEVRRSSSASPLITPPRVDLSSSLSGGGAPLGASLVAAVPPAIPPLGSSLSDLRATVVSQQRQLDGLVDKVASLLSAMHAEVLEDVRKTCRPGGQDSSAGPVLGSKDLVHFVDLRESEGGLRAWMQGQLREAYDRMEAKMREVQYHLSNEVRDLQGHLGGEVHSMRARISHLEDMTLDDDDDSTELRRHLEARLEAQAAEFHGSMGQLAAELQQHMQAGPVEQLAEDMKRRVDGRLQEHEAKDGILGKLREDLRHEAEARLEAKMTQTFGLAQRLMNELRQELQGQVVQVHEASQHLAVELRRGLEASLRQLARDGVGRGAGAASGADPAAAAAIEEQLAGCRAAAADCARCAIETAEATDHMEAQLEAFMRRASEELREECQRGLKELRRSAPEDGGSRGGASAVETSMAELEGQLATVQAALENSSRAAEEVRRDCEAQQARLERALQQQVQETVRKGLESVQAALSEARGSGDVPTAGAAAVEEGLAKARADAASSLRSAAEASTKAEAVESSLEVLSKRLDSELRRSSEAQEARMGESLRQLVRDEVQHGLGSAGASRDAPAASEAPSAAVEEQLASCKKAAADCTRCVSEASAKTDSMESRFSELSERLTSEVRKDVEAQESRVSKSLQQFVTDEVQRGLGEAQRGASGGAAAPSEGRAEAEAAAAVAEKHLAGCKAASADCQRYIEEASSKVGAAESKLKACGEEIRAQLGEEGKRLLGELGAARSAGGSAGAAAEAAEEGEAPTLPVLASRLAEIEEEVGSHRMLLMALREQMLQGDGYPDGEEESRSGTPHSGGGPSPSGERGGMLNRSARSASGSSDGYD